MEVRMERGFCAWGIPRAEDTLESISKEEQIPSRKQKFGHALDTRVQPVVNTLEGTERDNYQAAASTRPRKRRAVSYATL